MCVMPILRASGRAFLWLIRSTLITVNLSGIWY